MNFNCANPEFHIPHKPYYLRKTQNALEEIRSVTNNFKNIPVYFKALDVELRSPHKANMIYGQLDGPANLDVINEVNGISGFCLKQVIQESVIDFIWFQTETSQYLFWGSSKERVIDAMNRIRRRIIKCVKQYTDNKGLKEPVPNLDLVLKCKVICETPPPALECCWLNKTCGNSSPPPPLCRSISVANYRDPDYYSEDEE